MVFTLANLCKDCFMNSVEIIYQCVDFVILNKPAGMATEPPSSSSTLADWIVEKKIVLPAAEIDRNGIVHRLDTDTSGIIIWAKNSQTQNKLRELWQGRAVKKTYVAIVIGAINEAGTIELPIRRDNKNNKMSVALLPSSTDRPAITEYKKIAGAKIGEWDISYVELHPITGRTHQLRVHLNSIGHPIIGDKLYGNKATDQVAQALGIDRQLLHAKSLSIPGVGEWEAEIPEDMHCVVSKYF